MSSAPNLGSRYVSHAQTVGPRRFPVKSTCGDQSRDWFQNSLQRSDNRIVVAAETLAPFAERTREYHCAVQ